MSSVQLNSLVQVLAAALHCQTHISLSFSVDGSIVLSIAGHVVGAPFGLSEALSLSLSGRGSSLSSRACLAKINGGCFFNWIGLGYRGSRFHSVRLKDCRDRVSLVDSSAFLRRFLDSFLYSSFLGLFFDLFLDLFLGLFLNFFL